MNKILSILLIICLVLLGISVSMTKDYAQQITDYADALDMAHGESYDEGYAEGYRAAMNEAPAIVESRVDDDIWNLDRDIKKAHGFSSEDAIDTLTNYADGEPVSKSDLIEAIWAIRQYYWGVYDIVNDIEDYWID